MQMSYKSILLTTVLVLSLLVLQGCAGSKRARRIKAQRVEQVIGTARSYIGTPYKWGGTNRSGLDCSALLVLSYRAIGLELPRTSKDQSEMGDKVKTSKLQPGDLVFFAMGNKKRKVTHAGIITVVNSADDIRFIHASTSRGVIEANLMQEYYIDKLRGARRIL